MKGKLKTLREERRRLKEKTEYRTSSESPILIPADTVEFCRRILNYRPFEYMRPFLEDESHFIANVQARQTGKTFNGMAKLLHYGFLFPGSVMLITAPKFDQIKNIAFKALHEHLERMDEEKFEELIGKKNALRTVIRYRNGSAILAESPVPETIRGHTAKVIYLMEANFIREDADLYTAVLFTLNTTNGYLIAESTPWNTDSVFYKMFHDDSYRNFSRHKVVYAQALPPNGPLSPEIVGLIEKQLAGDPARWKREMLCEWTEDLNVWLPTSMITLAQDSGLEYASALDKTRGDFYVGVDFGKHEDYSVVCAFEECGGELFLRHCHQFPLETSYGAVIGYIKRLQDNWTTVREVYADKTGVGDYIVEDMTKGGVANVTGVNFTVDTKEQMATALKENMRQAKCPLCEWEGYVNTEMGEFRITCPSGCKTEEGNPVKLRPRLHLVFDEDLYGELNAERFELAKTGKMVFNHPEGTHDDRFWSLALAVYAVAQSPPKRNPPRAVVA